MRERTKTMRVGLTSENKSKDTSGYPRFKLEKDERARFCLIEPEPAMLRVHALRMPVVENGRVVTEKVKGQRGEYEKTVNEFVGQHRCTGHEDVFEKKELDTKNCRMCEFAEKYPDFFEKPYRRFGQHILQYKTQPGTAKVASPFQAELKVWLYTDTRFDAIVEMVDEHGKGNPRSFDIIAGPCESKQWQRYPIQAGGSCEWAKDDERKRLTAEIWKNNQCEDIESMIARKPNLTFLQADVDKVLDRWAEVGRDTDDTPAAGADVDDLNDLLSGGGSSDTGSLDLDGALSTPDKVEEGTPSLDLDSGSADSEPVQEAKAAPKKAEAPADVEDFDDLLGSMLG